MIAEHADIPQSCSHTNGSSCLTLYRIGYASCCVSALHQFHLKASTKFSSVRLYSHPDYFCSSVTFHLRFTSWDGPIMARNIYLFWSHVSSDHRTCDLQSIKPALWANKHCGVSTRDAKLCRKGYNLDLDRDVSHVNDLVGNGHGWL